MGEPSLDVFVVSDGTGETAEQMVKAALVQYAREGVKVLRQKNIRTESQVLPVIEQAKLRRSVIVFTLVSDQLRDYVADS
jgi:regulator of PEP synthase PpsR (kinase-PPPase family)